MDADFKTQTFEFALQRREAGKREGELFFVPFFEVYALKVLQIKKY